MRRMLGDSILPNRVSEKRRDVRRRLNDLREPVQKRREEYVPGPDIVGEAENKVFSTRNSLLGRVQSSDLLGGFKDSSPTDRSGGDTVSARNTSSPSQTVEGKEPRSTSSTGSSDDSDDDESNNVRTVGI